MTLSIRKILGAIGLSGLAVAGLGSLCFAQETAATPAAAAAQTAPTPALAVQVANSGKQPIVALYSSPPGKADWSDDMLGSGTLKPGQTRKLALKTKPSVCRADFSAVLDNGETRTRSGIDLCAPQPSVGF